MLGIMFGENKQDNKLHFRTKTRGELDEKTIILIAFGFKHLKSYFCICF